MKATRLNYSVFNKKWLNKIRIKSLLRVSQIIKKKIQKTITDVEEKSKEKSKFFNSQDLKNKSLCNNIRHDNFHSSNTVKYVYPIRTGQN